MKTYFQDKAVLKSFIGKFYHVPKKVGDFFPLEAYDLNLDSH